ncbi:MAG: hypothetical protein II852_17660 [Bacteroidales bacterium]|jgi:hypothetical protein|nr:hypothetical protein [Bacteroidales bacterium]
MEKRYTGIRTRQGSFCVNRDHIVISDVSDAHIFDNQEEAYAAGGVMKGINLSIFGMAALTDTPNEKGAFALASNATLVNEGVIEIHTAEIVKKYGSLIRKSINDKNFRYGFIKFFAMMAGDNSVIINNGVVKVYFDHDPDEEATVYSNLLFAGCNSLVVNNGELHILGNGAYNTHPRPMSMPKYNVALVNNGLINVDVERAATVRCMATTAWGGSITNLGKIKVKSTGRIMTLGRFADTAILNAGEIDVTSIPMLLENKVPFLYQNDPLACALYHHSHPAKAGDQPRSPIINSGTIKVHLVGDENTPKTSLAFGIYAEMAEKDDKKFAFENTGSITVTKSGPYDYQTAEMGVNVQSPNDAPFPVVIRKWNTPQRDFGKTKDLIVCGNGIFDLKEAEFFTPDGKPLSKENVVWQNEVNAKRGDTLEIIG